jgi:hypothetical protein
MTVLVTKVSYPAWLAAVKPSPMITRFRLLPLGPLRSSSVTVCAPADADQRASTTAIAKGFITFSPA